jgi:hypothetical protein
MVQCMGRVRFGSGRIERNLACATRRWGFVLSVGLLLIATPLHAAPPPDADPAMAPWFNSLRQPGSGISCCSIADCRPVDYRTVDNHYEAFIEGEWRAVPPEKVITRADNPTGRARNT